MKQPEIKIYVTNYCGFCRAAESLLDKAGLKYEQIDVTGDRDTRAWLLSVTGQRTVPQIFWNGESIGGYTDLRARFKELMGTIQ